MTNISIVTPSVRPEGLPMVARSLARQGFTSREWLIGAPERLHRAINKALKGYSYLLITEPPPRDGDYYGLNKCWNALYMHAVGELVVSIVDWLWFPPDTLDRLWFYYKRDPKSCVGGIGHQYVRDEKGRPEGLAWTDPRVRQGNSFYEISPNDFELCLASLPRRGIWDVGGIDEEYDRVAALSEKEMCIRMSRLGYKFFLDQSIEYRALQHPRLTSEWDEKYNLGVELFTRHLQELESGKRPVKLGYLEEGD